MAGTQTGIGYGWMLADQPYVTQSGNGLTGIVFGPQQSYWFDSFAGSYALYGGKETLALIRRPISSPSPCPTARSTSSRFYLRQCQQWAIRGHVRAQQCESDRHFQWRRHHRAYRFLRRRVRVAAYQSEVFGSDNAGLVASITLQGYNGSSLVSVRSVTYTCYGSSDTYGLAGDLNSPRSSFRPTAAAPGPAATPTTIATIPAATHGLAKLVLTPQEVQNASAATCLSSHGGPYGLRHSNLCRQLLPIRCLAGHLGHGGRSLYVHLLLRGLRKHAGLQFLADQDHGNSTG